MGKGVNVGVGKGVGVRVKVGSGVYVAVGTGVGVGVGVGTRVLVGVTVGTFVGMGVGEGCCSEHAKETRRIQTVMIVKYPKLEAIYCPSLLGRACIYEEVLVEMERFNIRMKKNCVDPSE